jgi:uncharacterized protein (TIGR02757 family)
LIFSGCQPEKDYTINLKDIYKQEKGDLYRLTASDPVEFLHRFETQTDKEIAGFLGSQFAYGQVGVFKRFLEGLFSAMGDSPSQFIMKGDFSSLDGLYYRFQKSDDIVYLFIILRRILNDFGGIGLMLRRFYQDDTRDMIWKVRHELFGTDNRLTFFFPKPSYANPMKRWNLYLRWMVRKDDIDAGLWDFIPKERLTMPLDTHIFKIGRCFGWIRQKNPSWKAACEMTEALKVFSPEDPLQYDFFLCQKVGIEDGCKGRRTPACEGHCILLLAETCKAS